MRVFDSNLLIYHLNGQLTDDVELRVAHWISEGASISVVTRLEVLGFSQPEARRADAERLLALFSEEGLHEAIIRRTINVRQSHRIRLPDAIIAATALHLGVPLVTRNEADFSSVDGIEIVNPFA